MLLLCAVTTSVLAQDFPAMVNSAGREIHWYTLPVEYTVAGDNEAELDADGIIYAVVSAGSAWNRVAGAAVDLQFVGSSEKRQTAHDQENLVWVADEEWAHDDDLLALTSVWSTDEGEAIGFDMEINAVDHAWSLSGDADRVDLQNAITHEFGHALGIGHITGDRDATMYPSAPEGEVAKRDLARADEDALVHFYPDGTVVLEEEAFVDPLAAACSSSGAPPAILATLLALALVRRRAAPRLAPATCRVSR